ncbi:MAG: tetratricopeptide repeat protein [Kouleothrix sp.]
MLNNLGFLYFRSGQFEASRPLLEQALTLRLHSLPDPHLATALTLTNLGELLYRQGELAKAETSIRHGFMMRTALISGQHNVVAESINRLGRICLHGVMIGEAERRYREALSMLEQQAFANPYELAVLHLDLAELLSQRQQTLSLTGILPQCDDYLMEHCRV